MANRSKVKIRTVKLLEKIFVGIDQIFYIGQKKRKQTIKEKKIDELNLKI